jgi:hypothetical protein
LLILRANVDPSRSLVRLLVLVITASILLHSSTDVLVGRWFRDGGPSSDSGDRPDDDD